MSVSSAFACSVAESTGASTTPRTLLRGIPTLSANRSSNELSPVTWTAHASNSGVSTVERCTRSSSSATTDVGTLWVNRERRFPSDIFSSFVEQGSGRRLYSAPSIRSTSVECVRISGSLTTTTCHALQRSPRFDSHYERLFYFYLGVKSSPRAHIRCRHHPSPRQKLWRCSSG